MKICAVVYEKNARLVCLNRKYTPQLPFFKELEIRFPWRSPNPI